MCTRGFVISSAEQNVHFIAFFSNVMVAKPAVVYHDLRFPNVARQCDMEYVAPLLLVSFFLGILPFPHPYPKGLFASNVCVCVCATSIICLSDLPLWLSEVVA